VLHSWIELKACKKRCGSQIRSVSGQQFLNGDIAT
jgi:hypothetical protein